MLMVWLNWHGVHPPSSNVGSSVSTVVGNDLPCDVPLIWLPAKGPSAAFNQFKFTTDAERFGDFKERSDGRRKGLDQAT